MKKFLIFGVNGMAGHTIAKYLIEKGHSVQGFARKQSPVCDVILGDARNRDEVVRSLKAGGYDYIVNAVGVLNQYVDACLSDGIYLNSVFPHFLAEQLQGTSAKLIHISTDCVFEGTKGHYVETDKTDAVSYYGKSKALGEIIDNRNLTIRTSIIGPELKSDGIGLFHWFMKQNGEVKGYDKVVWSGVTTIALAEAIEQDIVCPKTGLYHLVNNETISKYDLLCLFNKYCRDIPITILKDKTIVCDKSLINTNDDKKWEESYEEMVENMAKWIKNHQDLYEQYKGV